MNEGPPEVRLEAENPHVNEWEAVRREGIKGSLTKPFLPAGPLPSGPEFASMGRTLIVP